MAGDRVLHSWKDIANYVGRGIRTVQRYETQLGFPVHRPAGKNRSAVLGFADEIDVWLRRAPKGGRSTSVLQGKSNEEQFRNRSQFVAIAANARRSQESARAVYDRSQSQAKRLKELLQRLKAHAARRHASW